MFGRVGGCLAAVDGDRILVVSDPANGSMLLDLHGLPGSFLGLEHLPDEVAVVQDDMALLEKLSGKHGDLLQEASSYHGF